MWLYNYPLNNKTGSEIFMQNNFVYKWNLLCSREKERKRVVNNSNCVGVTHCEVWWQPESFLTQCHVVRHLSSSPLRPKRFSVHGRCSKYVLWYSEGVTFERVLWNTPKQQEVTQSVIILGSKSWCQLLRSNCCRSKSFMSIGYIWLKLVFSFTDASWYLFLSKSTAWIRSIKSHGSVFSGQPAGAIEWTNREAYI